MQTIIQEMVLFCRRYGQSIAECRQKQQDHLNRPPKQREPKECFYQNMKKKDQKWPNKNIQKKAQENHFKIGK